MQELGQFRPHSALRRNIPHHISVVESIASVPTALLVRARDERKFHSHNTMVQKAYNDRIILPWYMDASGKGRWTSEVCRHQERRVLQVKYNSPVIYVIDR